MANYTKLTTYKFNVFIDYLQKNGLVEPKQFPTIVKWKLIESGKTIVRSVMKKEKEWFRFEYSVSNTYLNMFNEILKSISK